MNKNKLLRPRIHHLEKFVQSKGEYCPPDIEQFYPGAMNGDYCPLCGLLHENYTDHVFYSSDVEFRCYICHYCDIEVDMVNVSNITNNNKIDIVALTRVADLINNGNYPFDSLEWVGRPNECFLCLRHIDVNEVHKVPLPTGMDESNFNVVSACDICYGYISKDIPHSSTKTDVCPECNIVYPLTDEEHSARALNGTLTAHYCGDCGMTNCSLGPSISRFVWLACDGCRKTISIDRSLVYDQRKDYKTAHDGIYLCSTCKSDGIYERDLAVREAIKKKKEVFSILANAYKQTNYIFHVDIDVYTVIYKDEGNKYRFAIVRIEEIEYSWKEILKSKQGFLSPQDANTEAVGAAYSYLRNKQIKLQFDE